MAKNTKQIGLMQQRNGKMNELPKQLDLASFGWAYDTNRLFIGNSDHPTLKERFNMNIFPYGNVEILTEFSDLINIIKYNPNMNDEKIYYPIIIEGTVENPQVTVGTSVYFDKKEVKFEKPGITTSDYDYLVLRYIWEDGKDLDTKTYITNSNDQLLENPIGWSFDASIPENYSRTSSLLYWSGDNVNKAVDEIHQEESILITRPNIKKYEGYDNLPEVLDLNIDVAWYREVGSNIKIEVRAYNGGYMQLDNYQYINVGGEEVKFKDADGLPIDSLYIDIDPEKIPDVLHDYQTIAHLRISKDSGSVLLYVDGEEPGEMVDPDTPEVDPNHLTLEEVIYVINNSDVNIFAKNIEDHIVLKTIAEELEIRDGTKVNDESALEQLGIEEKIYFAENPTKRRLQEVLDDRYSVKSFDVMGDDETNDGKNLNRIFEVIYNFKGFDPKELYFPADTYVVRSVPLILLTNTHLSGEGIDRTIIKVENNSNPLFISTDSYLREASSENYCKDSDYPHNILIENMTLDVSESSSPEIIKLGHSYDITFRNCKFICGVVNNFLTTNEDSIIKNIVFDNCVFEGNNTTNGVLEFDGNIDNILITNCSFANIDNSVIKLNGNDKFIENVIIGNNRFTNCGMRTLNLVNVNKNCKYVSVSHSLLDEDMLQEKDGFCVLNRFKDEDGFYTDLNYCDTPIYTTDTRKFLRFNFYQSVYDYVQTLYNKYGREAFEVVSFDTDAIVTNHFKLKLGKSDDSTLVLTSTSQSGDVNLDMGYWGDLHLGKTNEELEEWKINYPYNKLDIVEYNNKKYLCIENHTSTSIFEDEINKWKEISDLNFEEWKSFTDYHKDDLVTYKDNLYYANEDHISGYRFELSYWTLITKIDPNIIFHKNIDLNDNQIENRTGNDVIFKLNGKNKITINDIKQDVDDKDYKDRIGNDDSAIASVGYVLDVLNSRARNKFDSNTINEYVNKENSSELTLYNFDSEKHGNNVYLENVSINVRQIFVPINEQLKKENGCSYLDWENKIMLNEPYHYDVDDIVQVENNGTYSYYKCVNEHNAIITHSDDYDNFIDELNRGDWVEVSDYDNYIIYSSYNYNKVKWFKGDVIRYITQDEENNDIMTFYVCENDHIASILDTKEMSFENDVYDGYWKLILLDSIEISKAVNLSDYIYKRNAYCPELLEYIGGNLNVIVPEIEDRIRTVEDLKYVSIISIDNAGSEENKWLFNLNDVNVLEKDTHGYNYEYWESNHQYHKNDIVKFNCSNFTCLKDSYTSGTSQIELHDESIWKKLSESGFDYKFTYERNLFVKNDKIEVINDNNEVIGYRGNIIDNTDSQMNFLNGKYELINDNDEVIGYVLNNYAYNNNDALIGEVNEDTYLKEENYLFTHNFSNHTLKLGLYDENDNNLDILTYDTEQYFEIKEWASNSTFYIGEYISYNNKTYVVQKTYTSESNWSENRDGKCCKEIISLNWSENTNFYGKQYIKDENDNVYKVQNDYTSLYDIKDDINNGNLELVPSKYVQIGTSGEMLVTVDYFNGN